MNWFGGEPLDEVRWVVVDCESSGLDPRRDRLISVAAVPVERDRLRLSEAFHAVIRQAAPSASDNIVVHGIGGEAQLAGRPADEVLRELLEFIGAAAPVAFHAQFDALILRRAMSYFGLKPPSRWLDLAQLAPALFPARAPAQRALDHWLEAFSIECPGRHDALADAFATAQLHLLLLAEARRQGVGTRKGLEALSRSRRWLGV